jgi:hypothetical protein
MQRKSLLIGVLVGFVLGVSAFPAVQFLGERATGVPAKPLPVPLSPKDLPGGLRVYPGDAQCIPRHSVPRNWGRRYFNGEPYYIVPLG